MNRFTTVLHAALITSVLFSSQGVSLAQEKNGEAMVEQQEIELIEIGMAQVIYLETYPGYSYALKEGKHVWLDYDKGTFEYKLVAGLSRGTDYLYQYDQYGVYLKTIKVIVK
ncbi:hypothetical protein BBR47_40030 [Brevibacillus brevis NBRC 100599]|uniref:KTSC domain-containing protein n=1 Tax=Brevibacillus brevis (strain 47 / JCM 6285 / NBRC 100599) TaxID=358681 RepID=C0ZGS1_BREBN|nr:hypothetical protein [Brevibacillus brevis]BAH44980.1 hypothetical protein BBR47_40030 [Brevibacillus brevis NBRC 100599]